MAAIETPSRHLKDGRMKPSGCRDFVYGDAEKNALCTSNDFRWVKLKCWYVSAVFDMALDKMPQLSEFE